LVGARNVHGRAGHFGYDSFISSCLNLCLRPVMAALYLPFGLASAKTQMVDLARVDVDGFDALGNLVMSVGFTSSFTWHIFPKAQIVKTWKIC